jgi:hypothetical protein
MRSFFIATLIGALFTIYGLFFATPAHAVTVCDYLDANPTVAGVEDLVATGIVYNDMTPQEVGGFIRSEVDEWCPRHLLVLQEYVDKWSPGTWII